MTIPAVPVVLAPIFAGLGAMLSRLVFTRAGGWIIATLASLGLALGTQSLVLGPLVNYVSQGFGGLPGDVAEWVGFLNVDRYASIVISAYVGAALKGVLLRRTGA